MTSPFTSPLLAVVAALPEELAPLQRRLVDPRPVSARPARIVRGRLDRQEVALATTGDGEASARAGVEAVLGSLPVEALIAVGVAGGISADLEVGDLVWAEQVRLAGRTALWPSSALAGIATGALANVRIGVVVTVGEIADSCEAKQRVRAAHTDAPCAVVDLESAHYAAAAEAHGIPWVVLRAVSDTAGEALPEFLNRCRDSRGSLRRARVVRSMLSEPRAFVALMRLHSRVRSCAERLASAVERLAPLMPRASVKAKDLANGVTP
jgi:adenosylhomocysteine nucleosidase